MVRNHAVCLRLSSDELETLKNKCKSQGLDISTYLRLLIRTADLEVIAEGGNNE